MRSLHRYSALTLVFVLVAACATTNIPPIGALQGHFQLAADERELWEKSEAEQQKLNRRGRLYQDPLLEEYLNDIARRLIPPEVEQAGIPIRVRILQDPSLNAFAYPNGAIYIHTGLLARVENEAQLATVLGHEMMHVVNRDAVRHYRSARNKVIFANVAAIAASIGVSAVAGDQWRRGNAVSAAVIGQTANVMLGLGLQLGLLAAVNGYGRHLEDQADVGAMRLLASAGYDIKEAPKVHRILLERYGDPTPLENFFFGNHSRNQERIENYERLLNTDYATVAQAPNLTTNSEAFQLRTRALVRDNAWLDIEAGRFGTAKAALQRVIAIAPSDAKAHYYLGELYRKQRQDPADVEQAVAAYQRAVAYDATFAEPHRSLGLLYYISGQKDEARQAFERYLELKPQADDRQQVREYLLELKHNPA
ncbi:MAG TPA: tetratricopeptide repeat protein [Alphaproteobacteria bacterium]|nr:tetratricopeptide repeat protein [Alphaproteobacteria bacterium]